MCWQSPAVNEWIVVPGAAARHVKIPPPADPAAPGPFSRGERNRIATVLQDAALNGVAIEPVSEPLWMGPDVAVLGSLAATPYRGDLSHGPAAGILHRLPPSAMSAARSSLGEALSLGQQLPGQLADRLSAASRDAFVAGMHTAMLAGALVAAAGVVIALLLMPSR